MNVSGRRVFLYGRHISKDENIDSPETRLYKTNFDVGAHFDWQTDEKQISQLRMGHFMKDRGIQLDRHE
jgi:hypothetical protein